MQTASRRCGKFTRRNRSKAGRKPQFLVAVMVMFLAFAERNHASMRHFTLCMFELNRRVTDAEVMAQAVLHIAQDALAYRWRNICNRDVARERTSFRTNAPDVEIVNVIHAIDRADRAFHQFDSYSPRRSFEKNIQCLANN